MRFGNAGIMELNLARGAATNEHQLPRLDLEHTPLVWAGDDDQAEQHSRFSRDVRFELASGFPPAFREIGLFHF
jgi:hypothetical protein